MQDSFPHRSPFFTKLASYSNLLVARPDLSRIAAGPFDLGNWDGIVGATSHFALGRFSAYSPGRTVKSTSGQEGIFIPDLQVSGPTAFP